MIELYKNIKEFRIKLGLTQTQLAERMGYADKSMIAKIEQGKVDLPQSKIVLFAEALNTTPRVLMGWDDEADGYYTNPDTAEIAEQMRNSEEMALLFDEARDADPEDLKAIYNMLLALKRKERHE